MAVLLASLLLWGLVLGPETEAAVYVETRPRLWAEAESLLEPWVNVRLTCRASLDTRDFQLFKDGVAQEPVHFDELRTEHQFPLGAATHDARGLYRCRTTLGAGWTGLSNLVEVTGTESLPPPLLWADPVSWITPGLNATLLCRGELRGVTFLLKREGDKDFLEVAESPDDVEVTFPVHRASNYTCSYRTHATGAPSEPSAAVSVEELAEPPAPRLGLDRDAAGVVRPGAAVTLVCEAPLSGVEFELLRGEAAVPAPRMSTSPERIFFLLEAPAPGPGGPYTCRYQLRAPQAVWSARSAPAELLLSDGTLPAPELSAEPAGLSPAPGALVQLRCRAPRAGLRFALVREDASGSRVHRRLRPAEAEAVFELRVVSVRDSANYSCVYVDPQPPFAGSAPSAPLELRVAGPLPRPQLRPLWRGAVTPGRAAVLRCDSHVPEVSFELLREGEVVDATQRWSTAPEVDLELTYVGPQHVGNYTCRYRAWGPQPFLSELSNAVELRVAGS
ncbi:alpha-1B-glycoprotein isoform X2 [Choloepus didactylus]|uniref:alpha-1B-glycoprotein isoform X2 n=1 Tax=Choloepus didactylus TaxID=27675 RepID=UPI00189EB287|nr:alpha-1B-glycoprotein isoform X2 [Choloepus didactylus]